MKLLLVHYSDEMIPFCIFFCNDVTVTETSINIKTDQENIQIFNYDYYAIYDLNSAEEQANIVNKIKDFTKGLSS